MVQGSETGGRGQGLSVLRAVLIAGCVVLGLALAVVVLLAVVYREPPAEEVIQAFREEGLEIGETRQVDREVDRSFVPKIYKEQVSFTVPSQGERVGGRVFRVPGGPGAGARALRGVWGAVLLLRLRQEQSTSADLRLHAGGTS